MRKRETTVQNITLRDMLTMTAPYRYRFFAPYVKYFTSSDWVKFSLNLLGGHGKNLSYGYLWWVNEDGYAAMGDGGNIIYVNTKKKLVISIAALFVPKSGGGFFIRLRTYLHCKVSFAVLTNFA